MIDQGRIESRAGIARLRARDQEMLQSVVQAYLPQLLRAARGAGLDTQAAEDTVQDTFVTFIEKIADFEGRSKVRTFLFGILYRKIQEARRRGRRSNAELDIEDVFESRFDDAGSWTRPPLTVDESIYAEQVRTFLDSCMETLSDDQRMVFVMREVEDATTEEVCNILEITRTNMGVLLHRAKNRLRDCLESHGVEREGT